MKSYCLAILCCFHALNAQALESASLRLLEHQEPSLYALYQRYPQHHATLFAYAAQQGFTDRSEALATVIHELIHIDSATRGAFAASEGYLAPYLSHSAWPAFNNADIVASLPPTDRSRLGLIASVYAQANPKGRLGGVLDEINAYTRTLPFICRNAPVRAEPHARNLAGHITLVEFYLRALASRSPREYQRLLVNRPSRGALETLVARGYESLNTCFRHGVTAADPRQIPMDATQSFAEQPKPPGH